MQQFNIVLQIFALLFLSLTVKAQSFFTEGILIYKADTLEKREASPAAYVVSQVVVYKKANDLRIEVWRVNRFDNKDFYKDIHIRNKSGIYMLVESSDSMRASLANFAIFISYEEEKRFQNERVIEQNASHYKVSKVIENTSWFNNWPAQRVLVKGGAKNEESEMILTNAIEIPVGSVFDSLLGAIPGTPLQFVFNVYGWMTRLTATDFKLEKVADTKFQVNPKFTIMGFEETLKKISDFK